MASPAQTSRLQKVVKLLARAELFEGVDSAALQKIANVLTVHEATEGTEIVRQGEKGDSLFIILRGSAKVLLEDPDLGVQRPVAELNTFDSFGEMALLLDERRSATVIADEDVTCLVLQREAFAAVAERIPRVGLAIARNLAQRLRETDQQVGFRFVRLADYGFDQELFQTQPAFIWERHMALPLEIEGDTVTVAMVRPNDRGAYEAISRAMPGLKINAVAVSEGEFKQYIETRVHPALGLENGVQRKAVSNRFRPDKLRFMEIESGPQSQSGVRGGAISGDKVVAVFNEILCDALNRGASDIHIEPRETGLRVRLRVDGRLITYRDDYPVAYHAPLVSRVKITATLDIAEKRRPQDGRASFTVGRDRFDLRISTMATRCGEKVVMRVLDPKSVLQPLDDIILSKTVGSILRDVLFRTSGCVVVCGPTGSGKTTTLYSALNELLQTSSEQNICTVEDPIEYSLEGVTQTQVSGVEGCGFADVLRALLRQDPDVIMIGEMRDAETAQIGLEGALTGHMVLSTLHAEGAPEATTRLIDMGCPGFLVGNAVDLVIAQRLLRRNCSKCSQPHRYSDIVINNLVRAGVPIKKEKLSLQKGTGCSHCQETGYAGRVGAYEVMRMSEDMRETVGQGEGEQALRKAASDERCLTTFKQYGAFLLRSGLTTPAEILRFFGTV